LKKRIRAVTFDLICYFFGAFIFSAAVNMFIYPSEISPGGLTGVAAVFEYILSVPMSISVLVLNIPIIVVGFLKFGGSFILRTGVATVFVSLNLSLTAKLLPVFNIEKILAAIFGGILMGAGISIVMLRGATTGGIDIIAKLINDRFRHISVGKIILSIDAVVILLASIAYRNFESALYSVVSMYSASGILDLVIYGADKGKLVYIITDEPHKICRDINVKLKRGVTTLKGFGGYTRKEKEVLLCSVRKYEISAIYGIIKLYDPTAFVIVSDAAEITGQGFKKMQ